MKRLKRRMFAVLTASLVSALTLMGAVSVSASENFIINGDYEDLNQATGWVTNHARTTGQADVVSTEGFAKSGDHCVEVRGLANGNASYMNHHSMINIPSSAGLLYTTWVKLELELNGYVEFELRLYETNSASSTMVSQQKHRINYGNGILKRVETPNGIKYVTDGWVKVVVPYNSPAICKGAAIYNHVAKGTMWIDDSIFTVAEEDGGFYNKAGDEIETISDIEPLEGIRSIHTQYIYVPRVITDEKVTYIVGLYTVKNDILELVSMNFDEVEVNPADVKKPILLESVVEVPDDDAAYAIKLFAWDFGRMKPCDNSGKVLN